MIIYDDILTEFQKRRVRYVLVGGLAVNLHGALRTTADLDILVEMSNKNLRKVVQILKKKGYGVRQPVDPFGIADEKTRRMWIREKHMKAFNFYKDRDFQEVDIIIDSPICYREAKKKAVWIQVDKLKLPVISINHLIRMKQKAGRPVDLLDISELQTIKKLKGRK